MRNQKNRNSGERGEEAVNRQQNPRGSVGVDAENLEDSANQIGIKWRLPGAAARVSPVRIAEALTKRDRTANAAHLKAKAEVIFSGARVVLAENSNRHQLQKERQKHHPKHRSRNGRLVRSFHHGGVYQVSAEARGRGFAPRLSLKADFRRGTGEAAVPT